MIAYGPDVWYSLSLSLSLFPLQCGAENGGKRKKDRDLDELKKEVSLVRKNKLSLLRLTLALPGD